MSAKARKSSAKNQQERTLVENINHRLRNGEIDHPTIAELRETVIASREAVEKLVQYQDAHRRESDVQKWSEVDEKSALKELSDWISANASGSFVGEKFEFISGVAEGNGVVALQDLEKEHIF